MALTKEDVGILAHNVREINLEVCKKGGMSDYEGECAKDCPMKRVCDCLNSAYCCLTIMNVQK